MRVLIFIRMYISDANLQLFGTCTLLSTELCSHTLANLYKCPQLLLDQMMKKLDIGISIHICYSAVPT